MKKKQNSKKLVVVIVLQVIIAIILIIAIMLTKKKCDCVVIAESPILNTESIMQLKPMPVVDTPVFADWYEETERPTSPKEHRADEVMLVCGVIESEYDVKIPDTDKISLIDGNKTYREVIDKALEGK